jgi:DNA (cytosine-5)-methyltransferase 1
MYREFERALRIVKPKAFIVENVSGMRRSNNEHLFANQIKRFRLAGYRVKCAILDARDFGVPQDRARLFFVGIRSDFSAEYSFPPPTHARTREQAKRDRLSVCPTIKDAIGDLPLWPDHGEYDRQKFHWYYLSRDRYRGWSEFSRTIVATSRHAPLHPVSPRLVRVGTDEWKFVSKKPARRLSYREGARLQGFKRRMAFPDTAYIRMRYQVVGNAVPPPVFRAVVEALPDIF